MDENQRARFVSRSPGAGGVGAGASAHSGTTAGGGGMQPTRSQWHGMDLHTSTPSSHRRAMFISPVPVQPVAAAGPCANATGGDAARARAEAAALSARNQVLHRRLSERKRFDSADYAMKMVRHAMQSDPPDAPPLLAPSSPSPMAMAVSPPPTGVTGTSRAMTALQSPRLSPSHGRLVFAHALKNDRGGDNDVEMKDASSHQETVPPPPPQSVTRTYGPLQSAAMSVSAAMSARNIMIQKKLQEKRHFDSADYQLARQGVATDVVMEDVGAPALDRSALPFARTPSPMTLNVEPVASSPVNSPSAARAAISRSNQMSPSVRASSGATGFGANKYGGLGAMDGRGGGAGMHGNMGARGAAAKPQNDLRRNTLLRQQENYIAAQTPATQQVRQPQQPAPSASAGPPQKYGRLVAANILFRKNLKDRQRFDSADYQMEAAKQQQVQQSGETSPTRADNNNAPTSPRAVPPSASNQDDEPSSPVMKPHAKHMKLSGDAMAGGWAAHPKVAAAQENQRPSGARGGWAGHPAVTAAEQTRRDDGARLAARSVLLQRKLSVGKKHFDSGEYFAAKDKEARATSSRAQL